MPWRVMADIVVAVHAAYAAIVVIGFAAILIGSAAQWLLGAELLLPCRPPGDDSSGMRRGTCRLPVHEVGERASAKGRRNRLHAYQRSAIPIIRYGALLDPGVSGDQEVEYAVILNPVGAASCARASADTLWLLKTPKGVKSFWNSPP
jgi:hypothetical protein